MIYRLVLRLLLGRIDPETAHRLAARTLGAVARIPGLRSLIRRILAPRRAELEVEALGLRFPGPLGVAAGVDKEASWFEELGMLGFGFVEVGTVTAEPQQGNPRPRVVRLPGDRALLNSMGFPNPGAAAVAERLRGRSGRTVVGVNVGRSRATAAERADDDYRASLRRLAPLADYVVLNVSSPNTPGLAELQSTDRLEALVGEVREELRAAGAETPLLVKIGPDLSDEEVDAVADLALRLELDGIVAVNTSTDRGLVAPAPQLESIEGGGISGAPLKQRALEVLHRLHARAGDELALISVGGIETADDAWQRILAGATLVQAYTGFVYGGPAWPARINRRLDRRVRESGNSSVGELVGAGDARTRRAGR